MKRVTGLSLLMIIFLFILGIGCGTVRSAYRASANAAKSVSEIVIPGGGDSLRKRVLIMPVINQAGIKEETATRIIGTFVELLRRDGNLLVTILYNVDTPDSNLSSPQYGIVVDTELVKKAEEMKMDMLITTTLHPFDVKTKKSGIWPFRKMKKVIDTSISMNLLDITYGTLILAETETRRIKTEYDPAEGQDDRWEVDYEILDKEVYSILKDYSSDISDKLDAQPWTGIIKLADDKTITINGGKDIGITEGSIFEVFDKGETIKSLDGKDYFYLGLKAAEVKAEKIMEAYTLVAPVNSERLTDGQLVRLK